MWDCDFLAIRCTLDLVWREVDMTAHDQQMIFLKTNERRTLMYTYSYNLGLSDLNWVGSNNEWAFNVRRYHARFLFFSWTKLVLPHHSMTHSLEAMPSERGLCSRMLDPPSRKLVQPMFTPWVWHSIWAVQCTACERYRPGRSTYGGGMVKSTLYSVE